MRKKQRKKTKQKSDTLLVDKKTYITSVTALNMHLEDLMEEYSRVYKHLKDPEHPVLQSLMTQAGLISDIVGCLESSIVYGRSPKNKEELQ